MTIIPVGFGQVTHFFTGVAVPRGAAVTYGISPSGAGPLDTLVVDLHDAFAETILTELSSNVTLDRTALKMGPNNVGPTFEFAGPVNGGEAVQATPPNVAYLVKKATGIGGRQNRGRMYIPGATEADIDNGGNISTSQYNTIQTDVNAFLAALDALEAEMVILHNSSSDPTTVTRLDLDSRVATQRRRLR